MDVIRELKLQPLPAEQQDADSGRRLCHLLSKVLKSYMAYKAAELRRIYDLPDSEGCRKRRL